MMEINNLYSLLNLLTMDGTRSYHVKCVYADGLGYSIFEIIFTNKTDLRNPGKIIFQYETGKVLNYFYKGKRFRKTDKIIDLLLDIYNYEREKNASKN